MAVTSLPDAVPFLAQARDAVRDALHEALDEADPRATRQYAEDARRSIARAIELLPAEPVSIFDRLAAVFASLFGARAAGKGGAPPPTPEEVADPALRQLRLDTWAGLLRLGPGRYMRGVRCYRESHALPGEGSGSSLVVIFDRELGPAAVTAIAGAMPGQHHVPVEGVLDPDAPPPSPGHPRGRRPGIVRDTSWLPVAARLEQRNPSGWAPAALAPAAA
jgi:hypothetical protein